MNKMTIDIARDFSRYPMGRYKKDGLKTGEHFREDVLLPALNSTDALIEIKLDGAIGYGSSFLEEAFGGLIRAGVSLTEALRRIRFVSRDNSLLAEIDSYMKEAAD